MSASHALFILVLFHALCFVVERKNFRRILNLFLVCGKLYNMRHGIWPRGAALYCKPFPARLRRNILEDAE